MSEYMSVYRAERAEVLHRVHTVTGREFPISGNSYLRKQYRDKKDNMERARQQSLKTHADLSRRPLGQMEWDNQAATVSHILPKVPCTDEDLSCNYGEPHNHGIACDMTCNCKHVEPPC